VSIKEQRTFELSCT